MEQFKLGVKYYQSRQLQQAAIYLQQVLEKEPNHAQAWYLLGIIAEQNNQPTTTIQQIEQAIKLKPDYVEAHNNLGLAYTRQNNLDAAINSFNNVLQLKPDHRSFLDIFLSIYPLYSLPQIPCFWSL